MGEVYEVEHRVLNRRYALKLLPRDFATRPEAVRRFEREARVMANLEHPHIVRVDDFGETDGRYWLRMELVRGLVPDPDPDPDPERDHDRTAGGADPPCGGRVRAPVAVAPCVTLGDYAARRGARIEQGAFALILRQVLEALAYAHGKGVVHRDLKPGNILLERDATGALRIKVSDFGLARVIGEEFIRSQAQQSVSRSIGDAKTVGGGRGEARGAQGDQSLGDAVTVQDENGTSTRALLGTWEYMSPEQRRGEEADTRSDVYALGLMCYRLLTGAELGVRLPSQLENSVSPVWDEFVARALEQKAQARYADGREMLEVFGKCEAALKSENRRPTTERSPKAETPNPKSSILNPKSSKLRWAAAVCVLLLAIWAGWYFGKVRPDERRRKAELARIEAQARAARDQQEKARLDAEAERLRTEREKQQAADKARAEAEVRERERMANAKGGVLVRTEPAGATVTLGGEDVQDSPATFKGIKIGKYQLKISLANHETASREVEVKENEFTDLGTIKLVRSRGGLRLASEPTDAAFELQGPETPTQTGRTPAEVANLPTGEYRYSIKRGDWEQTGTVTVERGRMAEAKVEFAYGSVRITSEPSGAMVSAGGEDLGATPLELKELRPGAVSYTLSLAKHKPASVTGPVEARKQLVLAARLEKVPYPTLEGPYANSLGMKFVPVPGTKVLFCIWETRVRDYAAYAAANSGVDGGWKDPKYNDVPLTPSETCPVVNVSWNDAQAFCRWLTDKERKEGRIGAEQSYRLPSDAEWSWAVGIGDRETGNTPKEKDEKLSRVYPWGTQWPPPARAGNFADATAKLTFSNWTVIEGYDDGFATTSPAGNFQPNQLGLYDLSGNVWEWCEDFFDGQSGSRVLRGGSWGSRDSRILLSSYRGIPPADGRRNGIGFRCVLAAGSAAR
jgi:serine/threonine protein kinase